MNIQKILKCERERILNMGQLPANYKSIGIILSILLFVVFFLIRAFTEGDTLASDITSKLLLLSLLMISLSKEDQEDERIQSLRARSYSLAFIFGVIYAIFQPYINLGVAAIIRPEKAVFEELPLFVILWFMLVVQIALFHLLKRTA
jgi:hypothetical protein